MHDDGPQHRGIRGQGPAVAAAACCGAGPAVTITVRGKPVADLIPHRADATDLELAQRLGAAIASFDRQLNQAAAALGVALFADP